MKPPTNPLLDDAKQLLGNVGKVRPEESSHDARRPIKTTGEDQEGRPSSATQARLPVATEGPRSINRRTNRKYEALGLTYEDGAWKRSTKRHEAYNEENDISIYARTAEPDVYDVERWQDDAAAEFEDEFVVGEYMPRRKRRFVPKQAKSRRKKWRFRGSHETRLPERQRQVVADGAAHWC